MIAFTSGGVGCSSHCAFPSRQNSHHHRHDYEHNSSDDDDRSILSLTHISIHAPLQVVALAVAPTARSLQGRVPTTTDTTMSITNMMIMMSVFF